MASDLLSLADASRLLGVSSERVRQLVIAGDLPGIRFGNAWAVPREAVSARRHSASRRGRPLSAHSAWKAIADNDVELSNLSRYRNRAAVQRYAVGRSDLKYILAQEEALRSGVDAAIEFGVPLSNDGSRDDVYVSSSLMDALPQSVALVANPLGEVALRVVSQDLWEIVAEQSQAEGHARCAPRAAVALDLMEAGEPRFWASADRLIENHV